MSASPAFFPQSLPVADPLWLTKEEITSRTGIASRMIERYAEAGRAIFRELPTRGRNGKATREYHVDSLPAELRSRLEQAAPARLALVAPRAAVEHSPLSMLPLLAQPGFLPGEPVRAAIMDPAHLAEAERKLAILQPLFNFKADPKRFRALRLADGRAVTSFNLLAIHLCESSPSSGLSVKTLYRWKAAFEKGGLPALAPKRRADKGRSRWAAQSRDLADLAAYIKLGDEHQPGQSVQVAYEQVCRMAEDTGAKAPSYETIRAFLENPNEVSRSMKALQLQGKRGYEAVFAPYIRRGYTEPANYAWVSDHMICDTLVQDDCFEGDLRHCRLQMTTLLDYRSRMVIGTAWSMNGSSHSIKQALLRGIQRFGLPSRFYCDNGKDFRKIAGPRRAELERANAEFVSQVQIMNASVMKRLGVEVVFCKPFHPQSKHIERYHNTFHDRFDRIFRTYTAGATHLRRDETVESLARHKKLLKAGDAASSDLPLASEFIHLAEHWIQTWYNAGHVIDGEGMEGRTPAACFAEELPANPRTAPPMETLAALMSETERRKVKNCAVEVGKVRFVPGFTDPFAAAVLHEWSGRDEKVVVAFDPLDLSFAFILDPDGYFLCKVEREQLAAFASDDATHALVSGIEAQRGMLAKATRESVKAHGIRVRAAGYTSQVEQLREASGLNSQPAIVRKPRQPAAAPAAPIYRASVAASFFANRSTK